MTEMADMAMAEAKNVEEVDETKDPWDFEDPEVTDVVEETLPDKESAGSTEESALDLPDELVERARNAGLTDDDLVEMGSADRLEFVLGLVEDKAPVARVESADTAANSSDATNEDAVDDNGDSSTSSDDFSWIDQLDPDEAVDSDQARALKAMKSRMDELTRTMESMNTQTQTVKDNSFFSKLGEEWESLFGNSAATDYTPEQAANRNAVVEEMEVLRSGYKATKKQVPDDVQLFDRALHSTFGDQVKDFARQELNTRLQRRESQFIARASNTGAGGELLSGRDKAMSNVRNKMRDLGFDVPEEAVDTFE